VVGEVHLDDFDTNNLKTDFIRETAAWRELEEWISSTIEPVLSESRALAHAGMLDLKIRARIEEQRREIFDDEQFDAPGSHAAVARAPGESEPVAVAVGSLHLEHVFACDGSDSAYVNVTQRARPSEADLLVVRTNLDHVAASQISDRSGWACHNIAEAAALQLGNPTQYVELKGILLAKLLDERQLRRALVETARVLTRLAPTETAIAIDVG
jgi:hypothetical protein